MKNFSLRIRDNVNMRKSDAQKDTICVFLHFTELPKAYPADAPFPRECDECIALWKHGTCHLLNTLQMKTMAQIPRMV